MDRTNGLKGIVAGKGLGGWHILDELFESLLCHASLSFEILKYLCVII